jgi:glycosyltransferase involved in cell wall biosynthesis
MKVLIVSGIWPPDVGGPASHAPELAEFLIGRGHAVEAVVTADRPPATQPYRVHWVSRRLPAGVRHLAAASVIGRRARGADVVYATSMIRRAAAGARLARRPLVAKVTTDEAYERARRTGIFGGDLAAFQRYDGGLRVTAFRRTRTAAVRRAAHVFFPSAYLRDVALGWGLDPARLSVLPNAAPVVPALPSREELRGELGFDGPTLGFAGRLMAAKALDVGLEAVALVPGVSLAVVGEGPDGDALRGRATALGLDRRVRFLGRRSRDDVLRLFRAADAVLLSSAWENFPHAVVEALAVGTPVISTAVGGVPEVVRDGENGLLVPPGEPEALAAAIRRFFADDALRARLTAAAEPSAAGYAPDRLLGQIEKTLARVARP